MSGVEGGGGRKTVGEEGIGSRPEAALKSKTGSMCSHAPCDISQAREQPCSDPTCTCQEGIAIPAQGVRLSRPHPLASSGSYHLGS